MLNDVHFPPSESAKKSHKSNGSRNHPGPNDANTSRVLDRHPTAARADIGEAIYGEPEDRGDSFNTSMSLVVVVIVVLTVGGMAAMMLV